MIAVKMHYKIYRFEKNRISEIFRAQRRGDRIGEEFGGASMLPPNIKSVASPLQDRAYVWPQCERVWSQYARDIVDVYLSHFRSIHPGHVTEQVRGATWVIELPAVASAAAREARVYTCTLACKRLHS